MMLVIVSLAVLLGVAPQGVDKTALNEELWNAARAGDVARVTKALDAGADVNAGNRYKATALFFAADRGHVEVIKLLLDRGADINALDTFYKFRPLMMAMMNNHTPAVRLLLERGSEGAGAVLGAGGGIGRQGAGRCRTEGERPDCCRRAGRTRGSQAGFPRGDHGGARESLGGIPRREGRQRAAGDPADVCRELPQRAGRRHGDAQRRRARAADCQSAANDAGGDRRRHVQHCRGSRRERQLCRARRDGGTAGGVDTERATDLSARRRRRSGCCDSHAPPASGRARPGHRPDPGQACRALRAQALAIVSRRQRLWQW